MKINNNHVVSMHYTLKNDAGEVLDSSEGREPLDYIQGLGMIVPGLEKNMEGHAQGDKFAVKVSPEEGYGTFRKELVQEVPLEAFQGVPEVKVGMSFVARGPEGQMMVTVTAVKDKMVEIDGNHPLAGQNLNFDIDVVSVREATEDELDHGLHAEHGCCGGHGDDHECCGGGGDDHECCGGKNHDEDHECCGGKGHDHDKGHECCGGHDHKH